MHLSACGVSGKSKRSFEHMPNEKTEKRKEIVAEMVRWLPLLYSDEWFVFLYLLPLLFVCFSSSGVDEHPTLSKQKYENTQRRVESA